MFGASFIALSNEHPLSKEFKNNDAFNKFKNECNKTGTTEEALANAEKIGFKTVIMLIILLLKKRYLYILLISF